MANYRLNETNAQKIDVFIEPDHLMMEKPKKKNRIVDIFDNDDPAPEPLKNEELPKSFANRYFIKNLAALNYKPEELPGHMVKYNEDDDNYSIVSLKRFIKDNHSPEVVAIENGILYNSIINSGASFNGSLLIGSINVDSKSIMELLIQDVSMSIVTDSMLLTEEIKRVVEEIPKEKRENYFFIKGTILTIINNKKYKEQNFELKVNKTYVTAEGKVYGSNEKFSKEQLVSMDLISIEELI